MFRHILLPTDGSEFSRQAIASGIRMAKMTGAGVIGVHVVPLPHIDQLDAWMRHDTHYACRRQDMLEKFAEDYLALIARSALAETVPCICKKVTDNEPCAAIMKIVEQAGCDLICMAAYGWGGGEGRLLGGETQKVLHRSPVPVLVCRPEAQA
jgi:nucleotide-binding universal stress UspA family protein